MNDVFTEILSRIPPWKRVWWDLKFECEVMWYNLHSDEYRKDTWILRHLFLFKLFGFKPIMMGSYFGEDTFVFETEEEANRAFEFFERGSKVPEVGIEEDEKLPKYRRLMCGWWYSEKSLQEELDKRKQKYPDEGNVINGNGWDLGNTFFRGVGLDFIKLWEKESEK